MREPHLHGMRREQRPDGRHDGPAEAAHDDDVALAQDAVDEDDVHGGAQPLDHLHLEHRALQLPDGDQAVAQPRLRQLHQQLQQVRDACAGPTEPLGVTAWQVRKGTGL